MTRTITTFTAGTTARSAEVNSNTTFLNMEGVNVYHVINYDSIQDTIDAAQAGGGGTVVLASATYTITAILTIPANVNIFGNGNSSNITASGIAAGDIMDIQGASVILRDFQLTGENVDAVDGIANTGGHNEIYIERVRVDDVDGRCIIVSGGTTAFRQVIMGCELVNKDRDYDTMFLGDIDESRIIGNRCDFADPAGAEDSIRLGAASNNTAVIGNCVDVAVDDGGTNNSVANNPVF